MDKQIIDKLAQLHRRDLHNVFTKVTFDLLPFLKSPSGPPPYVFKGTVNVVLSCSSSTHGHNRFTTIPLKALSGQLSE